MKAFLTKVDYEGEEEEEEEHEEDDNDAEEDESGWLVEEGLYKSGDFFLFFHAA